MAVVDIVCVDNVTMNTIKNNAAMIDPNCYIKLNEVEGILQRHSLCLRGDNPSEWDEDWGEGWFDDDDDDDDD